MGKLYNPVTLDELNQNLLQRLNELIQDADPAELLDITTAVSKLNSSYKGNDQFGKPETEEERTEREQREMFKGLVNGEEV